MKVLRGIAIGLLSASCGGNGVTDPGDTSAPGYLMVPTAGLGSPKTMGICVVQVMDGGRRLSLVPGSPFAAGESGPSAMAVHPGGRFVYAASNVYYHADVQPERHEIWTFAKDAATRGLTPVGAPLPLGVSLVRMAMHPSGRFLYVTTDRPSSVIALAVDPATGGLGVVPGSPFAAPALNEVIVEPQGRFLLLTHHSNEAEGVQVYAIDPSTGALAPTAQGLVPAAGGPGGLPGRMVFAPDGRTLYLGESQVYEEFDSVKAFDFDPATGRLAPHEGLAFRAPYGSIGRGIAFTPSGRYLLLGNGSFRGRDIAVLRVLPAGALEPVAGSPFPAWSRNDDFPVDDIAVDASGAFAVVSNFWGGLVAVHVDADTGALGVLDSSQLPLPNQPGRLAWVR